MNKIKSFFKIFVINIIFLFFVLFFFDFIIYKLTCKQYELEQKPKFTYHIINPPILYKDIEGYFTEEEGNTGRKPYGLEYKNKEPIVIMGCSYAYGDFLNYKQTFSYKLSHLLERPVYNRGLCGSGVQHVYMQSETDYFYNEVPKSKTFIYIMIEDHYRRMLNIPFTLIDDYFSLHYKLKNDKFVMDNYNNLLLNFFKSSYTFKLILSKLKENYLYNEKNKDKITNLFAEYLIKTKKNIEYKNGNKINFIVILYEIDPFLYKEDLIKKLKENEFKIIETSKLTKENLIQEKYLFQDNFHPKEAAWDLLTPLIAEKL